MAIVLEFGLALVLLSNPTGEFCTIYGLPYLVLVNKLELVIPWWLENRVPANVTGPQRMASSLLTALSSGVDISVKRAPGKDPRSRLP